MLVGLFTGVLVPIMRNLVMPFSGAIVARRVATRALHEPATIVSEGAL